MLRAAEKENDADRIFLSASLFFPGAFSCYPGGTFRFRLV